MKEQRDFLDDEYIDGWSEMMSTIWRDKLTQMAAVDTGALHSSVTNHQPTRQMGGMSLSFDFIEYGIFVDAGTGKGYTKGNGGNLDFLSKTYRHEKKLGKARERRPWFSNSWFISRRVLADHLAKKVGDDFVALFAEL